MSLLKEFSYSDILQRRLLYYNLFATVFLVSFIFADMSLVFNYYAPYESTFRFVFLAVLAGLFFGNLAGRVLFARISRFRMIYSISDLAFTIGCALFVARKYLAPAGDEPLLDLFFNARGALYAAMLGVSFFAGIKGAYFLKIACGEFIDEKKSLIAFFVISFVALTAGTAHGFLAFRLPPAYYLGLIPFLIILPTVFLIKLPYSPPTLYAQEYKEHHPEEKTAAQKREDLAFAYLNFSYVLVYLFLGYQTVIKFFGNFLHVQMLFIFACTAALLAGFAAARLLKKAFLPLYTEVLYPPAFILFLAAINSLGNAIGIAAGIAVFLPVAVVFGFSIYHTLRDILETYDHDRRFAIIDFSLFVLPVPILAALHLLDFTYLWFFVIFYAAALLNTAIPVIHLMQSKAGSWARAVYLAGAAAFIPLMLFVHINFDIPLNRKLYVTHISGFADLAPPEGPPAPGRASAVVRFNGRDIFSADDGSIKNLQRSLVPLALFAHGSGDGRPGILFIDGNQRFFRNPSIGYFPGAVCLDYVPDRSVDFRQSPFTGKDFYFTERGEILRHLSVQRGPMGMIVDIPNLYDLSCNRFRFSGEYYRIVRRALSRNGLFVQVLNLSHSAPSTLNGALSGMKKTFRHFAGFLFSDHLVVVCADEQSALALKGEGLDRLALLFKEKPALTGLFVNEYQPLAHLLFTDIDDLLVHLTGTDRPAWPCSDKGSRYNLTEPLENSYLSDNSRIADLVPPEGTLYYFRAGILSEIQGRTQAFTLLKKAGLMEVRGEFDGETAVLAQLRRMGHYMQDLRTYINAQLTFKERYYYSEAVRHEKGRRWDEAATLYRAIIQINPDNFEANYRLGMLSITVQNLDDAFRYLQRAMVLKRDDTKVLYQMGVLYFAMGRAQEALGYFNRAMDLRENTASILHYTGLCHEKLGRIQEARSYYEKALLLDPNDCAIQSSLERAGVMIEDEKNRWKMPDRRNQSDVEQGESIPLPINQSARDIRLSDKEAEAAKE
ncbi:MAG TPA: tetratricopeptide repeat protein [Spirochaetota bacterium]|nr:tetratricopeptide repeat protein [Spirochaetota bacterium]